MASPCLLSTHGGDGGRPLAISAANTRRRRRCSTLLADDLADHPATGVAGDAAEHRQCSLVALFKDTTLVFIVGIFDLRTVEVARGDQKWASPITSLTGYAFAAMFYFACCYAMSRYAQRVEAPAGAPLGV